MLCKGNIPVEVELPKELDALNTMSVCLYAVSTQSTMVIITTLQ